MLETSLPTSLCDMSVACPTKIHVVFKCHLDVGFTDSPSAVLRRYFDEFIPAAMRTAAVIREEYGRKFVWTIGSYLAYEYFEQASPQESERFAEAIARGDIAYHALPFTSHTELMDASLFRYGLSLAQRLDSRFCRKTRAAKMTDVPGHTRAIVPLLADAGVDFLHIGVNPASTFPEVPTMFRWVHSDLSSITVSYSHKDYGTPCMDPITREMLHFAHRGDNAGPPSVEAILKEFDSLESMYPDAEIHGSTLDAFAETVRPYSHLLPVVRDEIGDTWIHGIASDPKNTSDFVRLMRWRAQLEKESPNIAGTKAWREFSKQLILVAEHTWGRDIKQMFYRTGGLESGYVRSEFEFRLSRGDFDIHRESWLEQRTYLDKAIASLEGTPYGEQARGIVERTVERPDLSDFDRVAVSGASLRCRNFNIDFDPSTGAVVYLEDLATGRVWATPEHPLGLFTYQIFDAETFVSYVEAYNPNMEGTKEWATADLGRPGLEAVPIERSVWKPEHADIYVKHGDESSIFVVQLHLDPAANCLYGCPKTLFLRITLPNASRQVLWELLWFEKPASRIPEASWLSFCPAVHSDKDWLLTKMGENFSPLEIVDGGNRQLHAVSDVSHADEDGVIRIIPLDSPLVAPGRPSLAEFRRDIPDLSGGLHFNLHNNVWSTNFPVFYSDDAAFQFEVAVDACKE